MKTAIVTGATAGIGKATAIALYKQGFNVVIGCRHTKDSEQAVLGITESDETKENKVVAIPLELSSFQSVRSFVKEFQAKYQSLDVLINNAGIMLPSKHDSWYTEDDCGTVIQVNYLSHFLLTSLLLDSLQLSPSPRVINLSSQAHYAAWIDLENFNSPGLTGMLCYGQSKLANIMFTYELHLRLQCSDQPGYNNIDVYAADPGPVGSSFYDSLPLIVWACFKPFIGLMGSNEKGAETSIMLATQDKHGNEISGKHFMDCKEYDSISWSHDSQKCQQLWDLSTKLTKSEWPEGFQTNN